MSRMLVSCRAGRRRTVRAQRFIVAALDNTIAVDISRRMRSSRVFCTAIVAMTLALVGGSSAQAAPGDLDGTFGVGGKVTTDLGRGSAVAIQSDGKLVAVGTWNSMFALARYNADGSLDTSFDGDGKVTTDFGLQIEDAFTVAIRGTARSWPRAPRHRADSAAPSRWPGTTPMAVSIRPSAPAAR